MKKVSIYVKGNRNSTAYYRIYQYLDKIEGLDCHYHTMMSDKIHNKYMPVSKQSIHIKIFVYIHIFCRMFFSLINDLVSPPSVIVVHRRIISRYMPYLFKILLYGIARRNVRLIWDFDDHIINSREVSISTFRFYADYADKIIVTHDYLKELISRKYWNKVSILPTTDGDMYKHFKSEGLNEKRLKLLSEGRVNLIWVATSVNLKYLEGVIGELDKTALFMKEKLQKTLCLKVVCNEPLIHKCKYLIIENIVWTRNVAIEGMQESHIGIMPLEDNTFCRGKGGFKLVQYLSIGLPCIGSCIGFNKTVISNDCGFLIDIDKPEAWNESIVELSYPDLWEIYSNNAYKHWESDFSYVRNLNFWTDLLLRE